MHNISRFPVAKPSLGELEEKYVTDALRSGWISSSGAYIERFEAEFASHCSTGHTVATNNGTTALHLVLAALDVGPGDEVVVPAFTYIATANAVVYCGAKPVFVDVDPATWCIDPAQVAAAITPRTKAVIAVDIYGHPADYPALRRVCASNNVALVADAAESLGGTLDNRPVGSLADATTFSFFGNKILTSGEGGCVTTDDTALADRMRLLRNQGMDPERRYYFPVVGFNYRMTNIAAAVLCAQLERSSHLIGERRRVVNAYNDAFSLNSDLEVPVDAPGVERAPWMASLIVKRNSSVDRDKLMARLASTGVDTRPFFVPLPTLPPYAEPGERRFPVSEDIAARGFNVPTFPDLTKEESAEIIRRIFSALEVWHQP